VKKGQIPLVAAVALDMTGFGMIIPDIQTYAERLIKQEGWISGTPIPIGAVIGAILSSMFIVQFFVSPWWGAKSDALGRKNVFLVCTLLSTVSMVIYALASTSLMLFLSRMLAGLGGANVAVAQASIADSSDPGRRTVVLGKLGAAQTLGLVGGPALGGIVSDSLGSAWVGWIAAGLSLIGVALVTCFGKFVSTEAVGTRRKFGFGPLLREFPALLPFVVLVSVAWFSLSSLEGTFGRLLKANWGYGGTQFGLLFGFESVVGLVAQGVALAWIASRFSDRSLVVFGYLLQGIGLATTPFMPNLAGLFVSSLLYALGVGIANPTVNGLCSKAVDPDRQGEVFGVIQSARSIGFILGPMVGGILFDLWTALPYLLAGVVSGIAAMFSPWVIPKEQSAKAG
jgi:MFS family permease